MHILTVCSGNICRSPMAEYLLRQALETQRISRTDITISSAGILHLQPRPIDPTCAELLSEDGIDVSAFRSTICTPSMVKDSDLVLCFEHEHLDDLLLDAPLALRHTFLFTDFANLCDSDMQQGGPEGSTAQERLQCLIDDAPLVRPLMPRAEEIPDPHHHDRATYELAHRLIANAAMRIAAAIAPAGIPQHA